MALRYWYEREVRHDGLGKYRHIRGTNRRVVEQMAQAQQQQWDAIWEKRLEAERKRDEMARKYEKQRAQAERKRDEMAREYEKQRAQAESERAFRAQTKLDATLQRKSAADRKEAERQAEIARKASLRQEAEKRTLEAQAQLESFGAVLSHTVRVDDTIQWERLKSRDAFPEPPPTPEPPPRPQALALPREPDYPAVLSEPVYRTIPLPPELISWSEPPNPDDAKYQPNLWWLVRLVGPLRQAEVERAKKRFDADKAASEKAQHNARKENMRRIKAWQEEKAATEVQNATIHERWQCDVKQVQEKNLSLKVLWQERLAHIRAANALALERWRESVASAEADFFKRRAEWGTRKSIFESEQQADNDAIDQRRADYLARESDAVRSYCDMVLASSSYPTSFSGI